MGELKNITRSGTLRTSPSQLDSCPTCEDLSSSSRHSEMGSVPTPNYLTRPRAGQGKKDKHKGRQKRTFLFLAAQASTHRPHGCVRSRVLAALRGFPTLPQETLPRRRHLRLKNIGWFTPKKQISTSGIVLNANKRRPKLCQTKESSPVAVTRYVFSPPSRTFPFWGTLPIDCAWPI